MLKEPSSRGKLTKEKLQALFVIAIFALAVFAVNTIYFDDKPAVSDNRSIFVQHKGTDTIEIDITNWDSVRIDSLLRTLYSPRTQEDDSMYKAYRLDRLDSLMSLPTSPLVDSVLGDLK
jgi:hypothetical protein